jgi:hypothetical protein
MEELPGMQMDPDGPEERMTGHSGSRLPRGSTEPGGIMGGPVLPNPLPVQFGSGTGWYSGSLELPSYWPMDSGNRPVEPGRSNCIITPEPRGATDRTAPNQMPISAPLPSPTIRFRETNQQTRKGASGPNYLIKTETMGATDRTRQNQKAIGAPLPSPTIRFTETNQQTRRGASGPNYMIKPETMVATDRTGPNQMAIGAPLPSPIIRFTEMNQQTRRGASGPNYLIKPEPMGATDRTGPNQMPIGAPSPNPSLRFTETNQQTRRGARLPDSFDVHCLNYLANLKVEPISAENDLSRQFNPTKNPGLTFVLCLNQLW